MGILSLLASLAVATTAAPASGAPGQAERWLVDRARFLTAEAALRHGDHRKFNRLVAELQQYPLRPYLLAAQTTRQLARLSEKTFRKRLQLLAGTPLARTLRGRWLVVQAARGAWPSFLRWYDGTRGTRLRCLHAEALFETGQTHAAALAARPLWLTGHFQRKDCDRAFAAWRRVGLPAPLVRERLLLAAANGNAKLVRYLRRFLSRDDRRIAETWLRLRGRPERLVQLNTGADPDRWRPILLSTVRRLAYRDLDAAVRLTDAWVSKGLFTRADLAAHFARLLQRRREFKKANFWFERASSGKPSATTMERWAINALALGRWKEALEVISALGDEARSSPRWQYWRARALDGHGELDRASELWRKLALERDYYGFLAADRLGLPYRLNDRPLDFTAKSLAAVTDSGTFRRARELAAMGRETSFRREWLQLLATHPKRLKEAALAASRQGWHFAAILTLGRARAYDDLRVRFPTPFQADIRRAGAQAQLDTSWLLATIRQESAFQADARSPAGAIGLMQLMPRTARTLLSRERPARKLERSRLTEPQMNIRLGSRYLRKLFDTFGHPLLASAAYNAGPARVRAWRPADGDMPADLWVETIPFRETRDYVRRVAFYRVIYARLAGDRSVRLSQAFRDVQAGNEPGLAPARAARKSPG